MKIDGRMLTVLFGAAFFVGLEMIQLLADGYAADPAQSDRAFRIGVILPLTGEASSFGNAAKNGMLLGKEDLLSSKKSVELTFEDDGMEPKRSVTAFRKLLDGDHVDVVICWSSPTCNSVASIAESAKIPLLGIASDAAVSRGRSFAFNFWVTPDVLTKLLVPQVQKLGYRRIAIASTTHDGSLVTRDAFRKQSKDRFEIVYDEDFAPDAKDFRTAIAKLSAAKPDAVLNLFMPGQAGLFAKQLRQNGVRAPLFGYEPLEDAGEVIASNGALVGAFFATSAPADPRFQERYRSRFPGASMVTANTGYDAVQLLADARAHGGSAESLASYLRSVKGFQGVSGIISATGDNRFEFPACLKLITPEGFSAFK